MLRSPPLASMFLTAFLIAACTPQLPSYRPPLESEGEVHLYLQPLPQEAYQLAFSITEISAVRSDGGVEQLCTSPIELRAKELLTAQKHLASARLSPGSYKGIAIEIGTASLLTEEGTTALLVPSDPLFLEQSYTVSRRKATALFLSLRAEPLLEVGFRFAPVFWLATAERQLNNLLGFATSSTSNVVSVFNKNTMKVVDTIATGRGPAGAAIDPQKGWVYIALSGDDAIQTIEVSTGAILGNITLNFGDQPVELSLSADGSTLVSANRGSNTASIVDADALREVARINLPSEPTSVVIGTSPARAYVFHSSSNAISAIDLPRRELIASRTLEEAPVRGALSEDGRSLYVITRNSPNLLAIDSMSLTLITRAFIGIGAASIRVDDKTGLLYVGKQTGEIVAIDPSSLMFIDTFGVRGNAEFLAIDDEEAALFVVSPETKTIQKLDLVSKRLLGAIDVQEGGYAVVLMGER